MAVPEANRHLRSRLPRFLIPAISAVALFGVASHGAAVQEQVSPTSQAMTQEWVPPSPNTPECTNLLNQRAAALVRGAARGILKLSHRLSSYPKDEYEQPRQRPLGPAKNIYDEAFVLWDDEERPGRRRGSYMLHAAAGVKRGTNPRKPILTATRAEGVGIAAYWGEEQQTQVWELSVTRDPGDKDTGKKPSWTFLSSHRTRTGETDFVETSTDPEFGQRRTSLDEIRKVSISLIDRTALAWSGNKVEPLRSPVDDVPKEDFSRRC